MTTIKTCISGLDAEVDILYSLFFYSKRTWSNKHWVDFYWSVFFSILICHTFIVGGDLLSCPFSFKWLKCWFMRTNSFQTNSVCVPKLNQIIISFKTGFSLWWNEILMLAYMLKLILSKFYLQKCNSCK